MTFSDKNTYRYYQTHGPFKDGRETGQRRVQFVY